VLDIKRIYVGAIGGSDFGRDLRQQVILKLQALNRFVIVESQDGADTALLGVVRSEGKRRDEGTGVDVGVGSASIEFVNVSGEVIWRTGRHRGTADEVASGLIKDLLAAIRAQTHRGKP
jgi:hypothetical protein